MITVDLNADLGEDRLALSSGADEALLAVVTSANVACGGHAGDAASMRALVRIARRLGVAVGAHPSYPDRATFGRAAAGAGPAEIEAFVAAQAAALAAIAGGEGVRLSHLKPHGALYHAAHRDPAVAAAIAAGAARVDPGLALVGPAGSPALDAWRATGFRVAAEAFADRAYEPDGTLRARGLPGALLDDPPRAAAQAESIVLEGRVMAIDGTLVALEAVTLCVHADTPNALAIARAVRARLESRGVRVAPLFPRGT